MPIKLVHRKVEYHEVLVKACPYCKKRKLIKKTCGHLLCQYKHHITLLRKRPRKTPRRHDASFLIKL